MQRRFATEQAEPIAAAFHAAYERLAPDHGYQTGEVSAVPWAEVPDRNRALMIATVADLIAAGVLTPAPDEATVERVAKAIYMPAMVFIDSAEHARDCCRRAAERLAAAGFLVPRVSAPGGDQ